MPKPIKKDFKFWLNVITIFALIFLVWVTREQIAEAFGKLASLNTWILLLIIPTQLASYYAIARLYRDFFVSQGDKVTMKEMYKTTLELNFINHVFPSGGVSGFSYLSLRLKRLGIGTAKSTLAQLMRFALTFISFIVLLVIALVALAVGGSTSPVVVLICSTIIGSTIFGTAIAVFIISKTSRIKAFVSWLPKALNYVARYLKKGKGKQLIDMARVERGLEELHNDYKVMSGNRELVKRLAFWALATNAAEVITIYIVYIAFGSLINPGALIIAYAVANFAGLIAVLPGGVGVYEGLMTATLASAGVHGGLALSATVVYRIITMVIFLPVGYVFYHQALAKMGAKPDLEDVTGTDAH